MEFFLLFKYWEKAEFPFHVIPKLGVLNIAGGTIKVIFQLLAFLTNFPLN